MNLIMCCMLFSNALVTVLSQEGTNATIVSEQRLCTPCRTLDFPPGQKIFFSNVQIRDGKFIPVSGGQIRVA